MGRMVKEGGLALESENTTLAEPLPLTSNRRSKESALGKAGGRRRGLDQEER